ncbi:MAG: V-type ATP synthase subunit D [Erysipelotrichia bacterium]|jgi:V/A-type H+-transporting ATPase subunit D|nr:V-type ATP synthase subunit D [Bacilli bacterium]MDD4005976.1 V-type ATP synthase subunit D [Bacilli bacterium]NMV82629.1 V-type ATP synthase subunit D [Erysipelotrichia bacterium]
MALGQINPTRMELTKLKNQLAITRRGHRLLKDKQDEMIRQFMEIVYKTRDLRDEVEKETSIALDSFKKGRAKVRKSELSEMTSVPAVKWILETSKSKSMSIETPRLFFKMDSKIEPPYALSSVPQEFDEALIKGFKLLPKLIELAQYEKTTEMYAKEIEKTRRRVNAIEHIMIPEQVALIKDIKTKLADQEMSATIRVMKSKEMIIKKNQSNRK